MSSYTVFTFDDASFPIIPYLPSLFTKKSDVAGKYLISSYLSSNIGFPVSADITPYLLSFIIIIISSNIAFLSENSSDNLSLSLLLLSSIFIFNADAYISFKYCIVKMLILFFSKSYCIDVLNAFSIP